jgi:hypothetical protein
METTKQAVFPHMRNAVVQTNVGRYGKGGSIFSHCEILIFASLCVKCGGWNLNNVLDHEALLEEGLCVKCAKNFDRKKFRPAPEYGNLTVFLGDGDTKTFVVTRMTKTEERKRRAIAKRQ